MLPPRKIDPHRLVALVRREMKLPEPHAGAKFPDAFGETPMIPGSRPHLDDDPWPPRENTAPHEE